MKRYIKGKVDEELALSTLAAKTLVLVGFDEAVDERTLVASIDAIYSIQGMTPQELDGPIMVGIAHGDYTAAEIEEWIENTGSWSEGDQVGTERANRKIRTIGIFQGPSNINEAQVLNDGKKIKTRLNWILNAGLTLDLWAYNLGSSALATTNPRINAEGHVNLFAL